MTSTVGVVTEEEIEASNADYVMDVIGSMPGVYIRRDAIYGRQDVTVRGLGSNLRRLQVLIDGRPEKMSLFGCTVTQTLPLANVERIEVLRGAESVLYGSDAMGGVINIVTKRVREPGYHSGALFSYGEYGTFHSLLQHGGNNGAFDYFVTYDRKQSDGHRPNSEYESDFLSFRTGYRISDIWRAEVSGQYFMDEGEDPGEVTAPYVNNDKKEYNRYSWDADIIGKWDTSEFLFTIYDNEGEHEFDMPTISDFWHSEDRTLGVNARYSREVYQSGDMKDTVTGGYEFQNQWAEPQDSYVQWALANMPAKFMDLGDYERNNHDLYVFNEYATSRWIGTLGLREHWDDHAETWETLPHAGLLYFLNDRTSARGKVSKGFRQPRFSELHLFPAHNEDLDPEEVWNYEASLNHSFTPWLNAAVTPFYMDVKNIVQTVANPSPPPGMMNTNSGEYYIGGVEAGFEAMPIHKLHLKANYTYTKIEDGPNANPNVNREGEPESVIDAVAQYTFHDLTVSADAQYISGLYDSNLLAGGAIEKVDDFVVFGLKGSYQVHRYINCFVGIENLFDEDYEQIPGYPMPGRWVYSGLSFSLDH